MSSPEDFVREELFFFNQRCMVPSRSLNLEATVLGILERVGFIEVAKVPRPLPWRHIPVGTRRRVGGSEWWGERMAADQRCSRSFRTANHFNLLIRTFAALRYIYILLARTLQVEGVRPISWANRTRSYVKRTIGWESYPTAR